MFMEKMNLRELENKIEFLRNEMIMIGLKEGLSSEKTISISQKLDCYIAKYQAQKTGPNCEPSLL